MICRTEDLKQISTILLSAVDISDISKITDNLELKVENEVLNLSVTNGEYYVNTKLPIYEDINFHATVNASIFLKLLTKITTEVIEFRVENNSLIIIGNGEYKIPLIYNGDKLLTLPEINIDNITTTFNIKSDILKSILYYNSKELHKKNIVSNPVQKLYYIDENGAITFTSGACVNVFKLDKPVKMLLSPKIVNLFKLFDSDEIVFKMGKDIGPDGSSIQTKISFSSEFLIISAIISANDTLVNTVPVKSIRDRAFNVYPCSVVLNRLEILQAIDRLLLFYNDASQPFANLDFNSKSLYIKSLNDEVSEKVLCSNSFGLDNNYKACIDLNDLKIILNSYTDSHVTLNFGDHIAFVVIKPNIYSVLPEAVLQ